ncbi:rhodanese-like domain-containing protein [Pelagibaculum spongiae]|nr:rhodanese-like domain-containing protein [Pelagibaculum spongiae]
MFKFKRIMAVLAISLMPILFSHSASASDTNKQVLLLDVRTPGEFSQSNYPKAVNLDYRLVPQQLMSMVEDKNQPVLMYCRSGRRASVAKQQLEAMGFTDIRNLGGLHEVVALCEKSAKPINVCSPKQLEQLSR